MPNLSYLRSRRREWQVVKELKERGFYAVRAAGSHSPFDVWSFNPLTKEVVLVQIKTNKNGRRRVQKNKEEFTNVSVRLYTDSWES